MRGLGSTGAARGPEQPPSSRRVTKLVTSGAGAKARPSSATTGSSEAAARGGGPLAGRPHRVVSPPFHDAPVDRGMENTLPRPASRGRHSVSGRTKKLTESAFVWRRSDSVTSSARLLLVTLALLMAKSSPPLPSVLSIPAGRWRCTRGSSRLPDRVRAGLLRFGWARGGWALGRATAALGSAASSGEYFGAAVSRRVLYRTAATGEARF